MPWVPSETGPPVRSFAFALLPSPPQAALCVAPRLWYGDSFMNTLAQKECVPCRGGVAPLAGEPLDQLAKQLNNGWQVVDAHHLSKEYHFQDFKAALAYTNRVGELAESQGHHPDIFLAWGKVRLTIWTHKIDGLTESDFVLAAKADALLD
jgi:4a-hydroxytetrahydrobiopterin dehydratase